jgi:hypothetical protein
VSDYSPAEMGFGMFATYYSTIGDIVGPSVFHRYGQVMDSGQDFSTPCSYRCAIISWPLSKLEMFGWALRLEMKVGAFGVRLLWEALLQKLVSVCSVI